MLSQENFNENLQALIGEEKSPSFLLAVSGGVDSMVLLYLISNFKSQISNSFVVAHINYKLRGKDSDLDQKLVEDFCENHQIKLHIYQVSEKDQKPENASIQLWARELRYRFFREIQEQENLKFLLTAHHLNDQLETFFINLSRGSGIAGLSGIPTNENQILRPLLPFSKEEIYAFAKENDIPFREDISNAKNDYLRNKIRNTIIPHFLDLTPHFLNNFKKSINILNQSKDFIYNQIDKILTEISIKNEDDFWILNKEKLSQESPFVQFEILKKFGFDNKNEIAKIFTAETGKIFYSENYTLLINRNELIIRLKTTSPTSENIILEIENDEVDLRQFIADWEAPKKEWILDKSKVKFPLYLRRKREGDVFYPIGMQGKKKVSKFLKDEKLSLWEKEKIWLLCDAHDHILGVLPLRQDRRFINTERKKNCIIVRGC